MSSREHAQSLPPKKRVLISSQQASERQPENNMTAVGWIYNSLPVHDAFLLALFCTLLSFLTLRFNHYRIIFLALCSWLLLWIILVVDCIRTITIKRQRKPTLLSNCCRFIFRLRKSPKCPSWCERNRWRLRSSWPRIQSSQRAAYRRCTFHLFKETIKLYNMARLRTKLPISLSSKYRYFFLDFLLFNCW